MSTTARPGGVPGAVPHAKPRRVSPAKSPKGLRTAFDIIGSTENRTHLSERHLLDLSGLTRLSFYRLSLSYPGRIVVMRFLAHPAGSTVYRLTGGLFIPVFRQRPELYMIGDYLHPTAVLSLWVGPPVMFQSPDNADIAPLRKLVPTALGAFRPRLHIEEVRFLVGIVLLSVVAIRSEPKVAHERPVRCLSNLRILAEVSIHQD